MYSNRLFQFALIVSLCIFSTGMFAEEAIAKGPGSQKRSPANIENEIYEARMKLADLLATARLAGKVCETGAYSVAVLKELNEALWIKSDSDGKLKLNEIPESIKSVFVKSLAFRQLTGDFNVYTSNQAQVQNALVNTEFFNNASGAYGSTVKLSLNSNGVLNVKTLELLDEEPWTKWKDLAGTWGVRVDTDGRYNQRQIRVWFRYNSKITTYHLDQDYRHQDGGFILRSRETPSNEDGYKTKFTNERNDECDA